MTMTDVKVYYFQVKLRDGAMRWRDTAAHREAFADWFSKHGALFETRGDLVQLPDDEDNDQVKPGDWIVYSAQAERFFALTHEEFCRQYEVPGYFHAWKE